MIPWLPLVVIAAHLLEEFVWPGGFAAWYRRIWPERAASVTPKFLVGINALNVLLAIGAGQWFDRPVGLGLWLVVASLAAANGVFHLRAVLRTGIYSPGVVTGVVLYIPLAAWGFVYFALNGARADVLIQAALIGPAYHFYSAWNHRRRARRFAA